LAAHGHCPVAVIRDREPGPGLPASGAVVVGVDGSSVSESAVAIAFEEASARGADLIAVHAWLEFVSAAPSLYANQLLFDWAPIENQQREILAERLAGWQEKYPDVTVHRVVSREEKPAQALQFHAADAQLLVVGSRGHGGFVGMLLGSTSRKLIHDAPCPLMVVRPSAAG
jgi:nucleotide-binding universal stress UspA family protein